MINGCSFVCITPTRNEAWIIKPFLAAAKCWADHIVVADQLSTDETFAILSATPGVEAVANDQPQYDEGLRRELLLTRARRWKNSGKRVLIGLDADEALSANCLGSKEWQKLEQAKPGTILRFRWVNILPGFEKAWIPPNLIPCGYVDDGAVHAGGKIHSGRVPHPPNAPVIDFEDVVVLHFQYVSWERMLSKHRWYQGWEFLQHKKKRPLEIFRQYHHMFGSWDKAEIHPVNPAWFKGYDDLGIDFRSLKSEPITWWDNELFQMISDFGAGSLRKAAIWDKDWNEFAARLGKSGPGFSDPRSQGERIAHRLLKATQKHRGNWGVRAFEHLLRRNGW